MFKILVEHVVNLVTQVLVANVFGAIDNIKGGAQGHLRPSFARFRRKDEVVRPENDVVRPGPGLESIHGFCLLSRGAGFGPCVWNAPRAPALAGNPPLFGGAR
jgi:hypothetical protein